MWMNCISSCGQTIRNHTYALEIGGEPTPLIDTTQHLTYFSVTNITQGLVNTTKKTQTPQKAENFLTS